MVPFDAAAMPTSRPALEPEIMQLVFQLYQAQMLVHNAHLGLNTIEANLNQRAAIDPTLTARAHFAYDALCQTLAAATTTPTRFAIETPTLPSLDKRLDFSAFAGAFKSAFPNSEHLFHSPSIEVSNGLGSHPLPPPITSLPPLPHLEGLGRSQWSALPSPSRADSTSLEDLLAIHDLAPGEVEAAQQGDTTSAGTDKGKQRDTNASPNGATINDLVTSGPMANVGFTTAAPPNGNAGSNPLAPRLHMAHHAGAQLLLHASSISDAEGPVAGEGIRRNGSPFSLAGGEGTNKRRKRNAAAAAEESVDDEGGKRATRRRIWESDADGETDTSEDDGPSNGRKAGKSTGSSKDKRDIRLKGSLPPEDGKAKPKTRRQPRTMSYDDAVQYSLNEHHHFLLVQTKTNQPELSDRACTELFLITNRTMPTSPLGRLLLPHPNTSRAPYTAHDYAEDVRVGSEYTFHTAAGVTYEVKYLPSGPRITPTLPIASHSTTLNFIHFPPQTIVTSASPLGSLPWWRVQACVGETKHRGMPGPDGAWTARWDKDPRDRRPARIVEHFGKCKWRSLETDPVGRLARALLAASDK